MEMLKILLVDDEKDTEMLFKQVFRNEIKKHDFEFHFALNAEEALKYIFLLNPFDVVLVLSDINMPGMNGIDLLKEIKKIFPIMKVIMITAYDNESNYNLAIKNGADGFMAKPVDFDLLRKKINEYK
jgi:two-component system, response regulator, stage 0 sporulation protein F